MEAPTATPAVVQTSAPANPGTTDHWQHHGRHGLPLRDASPYEQTSGDVYSSIDPDDGPSVVMTAFQGAFSFRTKMKPDSARALAAALIEAADAAEAAAGQTSTTKEA